MEIKRYKPAIDKLFYAIWIPTSILMITATVISFYELGAFILMLAVDVFTFYFMISSLVGYVELRMNSVFVKFGFIIKREIPYDKIRKIAKERKIMSNTYLSLKNSLDHVSIKYNKYDEIVVSVINNDDLIKELNNHITIE
jgi:hypothetical protein